ncbi:39S ribosomal protein L12 [Sarcoptes scabiei]|uniref:39S ribosomal protein L12, mitochondrial n=2 Tax=Sarcoptes scabiei TaxID=52283 RepID=A0A834R9I8_SARSC|nr:39S ribosomal protein L12 [Sarcoptes scabiei]
MLLRRSLKFIFSLDKYLGRSSFTLQHRSTASLSENKKILEPFETSPKIQTIVDQISQLSLLEVAELNQALKTQLKIPDAPVMYAGAAVAAEKTQEEDDKSSQSVQTSFTLKLEKFDETKKVSLIKEIKGLVEGLNLVQAKKFVESAPQIIKNNLSKDEAEKLKATLEAAGGVCLIE